ncbi:MAG: TonB-dependent receptor, partial [Granulicella sp.]
MAFSIPALGQGTSQSGLVGTITDATGAVIPGATVRLINTQTNAERTVTTGGGGDYSLTNLQPANYRMRVEKDGFKASTVAPFDLLVGKIQSESVTLQIGSSNEEVQVSTESPQLQTADATIGQVIDQKQVNDLPLNGRGVLQLATLSAGVSPPQSTQGSPAGQTGSRQNYITVDGGRPTSTNYVIDGVYARNLRFNTLAFQPNLDTIQEFNILRNGFSTEFGQGQSVVSMVTKSGTNQIHGSAYIYTRSQILDARLYTSTYASNPKKPVYHRNQYGATVGGPIIKNRVFGFFGFEGLRTAQARTYTGNYPLASQLTGATAPLAIALIPTIPTVQSTSNCAGCSNGVDYTVVKKFVDNYDEYTGRADQVLSSKHTLFERYIKYDASQLSPSVNSATSYPATAQNLAIGDTYLITPTLVNEFRIGLQRAIGYIQPVNFGSGNTNWVALAGLINLQGGAQSSEFGRPAVTYQQNQVYTSDPAKLAAGGNPYPTGPQVLCPADPVKLASASGYSVNVLAANCNAFSGIGEGGLSQGTTETNYGVSEVLSDVIGRHTIRTGVQYQYRPVIALADNGARGNITFNSINDFVTAGAPYVRASGEFGSSLGHYTDQTIGVFINDIWQIAPRLTANVGIRWEYVSPFVEKDGLEGSLDPKTGLIGFNKIPKNIPAIVLPSLNLTPGVFGPGIIQPDRNNFGPRLGLAYQFSQTATVRGGFGIFFDNTNLNELQFTRAIPPFYIQNNLTTSGPQDTLFPSNPVLSPPPFSVFAGNRTPYTYEWNMSFQQDLGHNLLFELAYTGSSTHKLSKRFDWNEDVFSGIGPTALNLGRPWTRFQHGILTSANNGASNFHGLATRLEQR